MADGSLPAAEPLRALALGINWFATGSGGLDRVYRDLALSLPGAGIDLQGLVLGPTDIADITGGRIRAYDPQNSGLAGRLLRGRRAIAAALRHQEPDIVAAHFALFAFPALDLLARRPFVVHFHGPWADEAAEEGTGTLGCALRYRLERAVYARATRVITLSHAFAVLVQARYAIPADRIRVVPGSVDLPRFAPTLSRQSARAALRWPEKGKILLTVRRLVRRMGLDRLIEAMPAILAAEPDARLVIAGRGAEEAALKTLAADCGVAGKVCFPGFLAEEDLPVAYRAADLNVVPTRALEGFGLTAAEALASGTPSVVAPVGGLPEIVSPLSGDLVFASTNSADIAATLIAALRNGTPDEAACLAYARAKFSGARMAAQTAQIYREAAMCRTTA